MSVGIGDAMTNVRRPGESGEWTVRLAGAKTTMEEMVKVYIGSGLSVQKDRDEYQLRSAAFLAFTDAGDVQNAAEHMLRRLCGLLNIYGNVVGEVWPENAMWRGSRGNWGGIGASLRGTVTVKDASALEDLGAVNGGVSKGTHLQVLAGSDPALEALLSLTSWDTLGWGALYMQFELLRESYGGEKLFRAATGLAAKDVDRFTETANSFRHASVKKTFKREMDIGEARKLLRHLCKGWIDSRL